MYLKTCPDFFYDLSILGIALIWFLDCHVILSSEMYFHTFCFFSMFLREQWFTNRNFYLFSSTLVNTLWALVNAKANLYGKPVLCYGFRTLLSTLVLKHKSHNSVHDQNKVVFLYYEHSFLAKTFFVVCGLFTPRTVACLPVVPYI